MDYRTAFGIVLVFMCMFAVMTMVLWIRGGYSGKIRDLLIHHNDNNKQHALNSISYSIIGQKDSSKKKTLFIGNSITLHGQCEYWWGDWGMAASEKDKDYVHAFAGMISRDHNIDVMAVNFSQWETMWYDRSETFSLLRDYLYTDMDMIVIQLGENVTEYETLENDFDELLKYITTTCPQTEMYCIGNIWENEKIDEVKKKVCERYNCTFISLDEIIGQKEYWLGTGKRVKGSDGEYHISNHKGVALHPNDLGMQRIALMLYNEYKKSHL